MVSYRFSADCQVGVFLLNAQALRFDVVMICQ
uniref:Uncharacterized protein n=1 Tax=Arundo donax TaxID=35708 RepID=A0A0A9BWJ0_ARUDO